MTKNFLEINNVTFKASEKNKVNNVSLSIENEGDIVCLLGPSGIGKTTILRTIAGLEKIDSGTIVLKNQVCCPQKRHISNLKIEIYQWPFKITLYFLIIMFWRILNLVLKEIKRRKV